MANCSKCGNETPETARFCPACAAPLSTTDNQLGEYKGQPGVERGAGSRPVYWVSRHPILAILVLLFFIGGITFLRAIVSNTETGATQPTGVIQQAQKTEAPAVVSAPAYKLTPTDFCEERDAYAKEADHRMLDSGIESTTAATSYPFHESGSSCPKKDNTALVVSYAGADRVWANTFGNTVFLMELSVYGFKKLVLTNGLSGSLKETYTWTVPACPEDICAGLSQ